MNIPLWTLIVLTVTPIINMVNNNRSGRKRIRFISLFDSAGKVAVNFCNNSFNRRIFITKNYYTLQNYRSDAIIFKKELLEGDDLSFIINVSIKNINEINSITIIDSGDKKYTGYLYKGTFHWWFTVQILRFKDFITGKK